MSDKERIARLEKGEETGDREFDEQQVQNMVFREQIRDVCRNVGQVKWLMIGLTAGLGTKEVLTVLGVIG